MFQQNDFELFADALEDVGAYASIAMQVEEAIAAIPGFSNKEWLEWGERIMPELAARVAIEKRDAMLDVACARAAAFDEDQGTSLGGDTQAGARAEAAS